MFCFSWFHVLFHCLLSLANTSSTYSSLDVTAPLVLGSHPSSFNYGPEASYFPYNGFIRNMRVSNIVLDFSTPLTSEGVFSSLSLENDPCADSPCLNRAQCLPTGFTYVCLCGSAFTGQNCQEGEETGSIWCKPFVVDVACLLLMLLVCCLCCLFVVDRDCCVQLFW